MNRSMSRRELVGLGAVTGAALVGPFAGATGLAPSGAPASGPAFPWEYRELDVERTRRRAYDSFSKGGCMYAVFEAIAGQAAEALGPPYTDFPFALSSYGGGGVANWGTLCGTCNGGAMAIALFHQGRTRSQLISELFAWYEATPLPVFVPDEPVRVKAGYRMAASQADSTLCHVSITRWVKTSGHSSFDPERLERCSRVAADMAGHAVSLLNQVSGSDVVPPGREGDVANGCLGCHAKGQQAPGEPEVVSRMHCTTCHEPHDTK
jgi:hypothetical protein